MSYSGKKIGNQFGFVHSDAAMTIAEGDYPLYRHAQPVPEMKPVGYLFVSEQGAIAYSPANWGMPGFRLIGQIYGDIDVESQPAPVVLKDHEIRELVNQLRDVAIKYHAAGQLREQISRVIRSAMLQTGNSPVIPDGYVMVPKVATEKMLIAGLEEADPLGSLIDWDASRGDCNTREQVQGMFEAMLAAASQEGKS